MYPCWKQSSFINECQISTPGLSLLIRMSVIPANVCLAYQLDHHVACRRRAAFWCMLCLAAATHVTPAVCKTKHGLKYRPHFVPTICQCEPSRLLASLAESDYCWLLSHSVSAETRKPIYRIRRYASAVNEYSSIYDIGLTLLSVDFQFL